MGYTISKGSRSAAAAGSTSATDVVLTITPLSGFTVAASDFSHLPLPAGIDDVTFSDTDVPYSKNNTVRALVDINASYAMPSADTTLSPKITGTSRRGVLTEIGFCVTINEDTSNTTSVVTAIGSSSTGTANTVTKTTSDGKDKYKFLGKVPIEPIQTATSFPDVNIIGEYAITCNEGFHFDVMPSLDSTKGQPLKVDDHLYLRPKSQVVDSTTNLVTAATYEIIYKNTKIVEESNQISADLKISTTSNFATDLRIIDFYNSYYEPGAIGAPSPDLGTSTVVSPDGTEFRRFYVIGNIGAKFNLKATNGSKHLFTEYKNQEIQNFRLGSTDDDDRSFIRNSESIGVFDFSVHFTAVDASTSWNFQLTPGDDTTLGTAFDGSGIDTLTLLQAPNPTINITNSISGGHGLSGAATLSTKGLLNKEGEELRNIRKGFKTIRDINWVITRSGGGTFTVIKTPEHSDFTNTDSTKNGGSEVRFKKLAITGGGTATITITGQYVIDRFGDKDVSMNLNLDNIIS